MAGVGTDRRLYQQCVSAFHNDRRMASDYRFREPRDVHRPSRILVVDGRSILAAVAEGDSDIVLLERLTSVGRK
jgi:hypothetical protein